MKNRFAITLTMLTFGWFAIVEITPCQAGPIALETPAGLTPGETFRFMFVTDDTTVATSSNIATYDAFVQADAGGATYNGVEVNWQAIGSTASVNAITHIGVNPGISGVYLPDGTLVTPSDGSSGLWSGSLTNAPDETLNGAKPTYFVWTGTSPSGTAQAELGGANVEYGYDTQSNSDWVVYIGTVPSSDSEPIYGISAVLTVAGTVPEPSTGVLAGMGSAIALRSQRSGKARSDGGSGPWGPDSMIGRTEVLNQPARNSRQHWLRLSVRGFIVFVLASGAGLGWIVRSARIQRDAVAAISENGGNYSYDWEWRDGKSIPGGIPWAPRWLVDRIGIDYFGHVTRVALFPVANDEVLVNVGRLNQLQELNLYRSTVSDAGLLHLNGLSQLTRLYLGKTAVSDAGLAHLGVLGNLHELHLDSTNVSDAGLAHLKRVGKLTKLDLRNTQVTDAGLVHIRGLTDLTRLAIEGPRVTNSVIKELKQAFPNLKADIYGPFNGHFTFD